MAMKENAVIVTTVHKNVTVPQKELDKLPCCPICGKKAYLHGDTVMGFWFGWSVGCPSYCLNDGIHGHDDSTPRKERLFRCGFASKKTAIAWWKRRVAREKEKVKGQ